MPLVVQNWVAMRDTAVWGEDAAEFKPERMLDGKFEALPVRRSKCHTPPRVLKIIPSAQRLATLWIRYASMHREHKTQ